MFATVVLVGTFLCGVMVGRGVRAERGDQTAQTIDAPAATPPPTSAAPPPSAPATPAPAGKGQSPAPPEPAENDYYKSLTAQKPDDESLKASAKPKPEASAPPPASKAAPASAAAAPPAARKIQASATAGRRSIAAGGSHVWRVRRADHGASRSRRSRRHREAPGREGLSRVRAQPAAGQAAGLSRPGRPLPEPRATPTASRAGCRRKSSSAPGLRASAALGRAPRAQLPALTATRRWPGWR